jgi:CRP-like cAMP-binding protein
VTIDTLIASFKHLRFNDTEKADLAGKLVERSIKRRQFILQEGDVCKHFTFVAAGCFRKFHIDSKGSEHNLQFAAENDWIMDIASFYSEKPSIVYIEAIEPSVVLQISRPDLIDLFRHNPKFDRNFRVVMENKYVELENRMLEAISSTAEQRYRSFLNQHPKLSLRLPNTQIASYLGITPEFLSKIRKDIAGK